MMIGSKKHQNVDGETTLISVVIPVFKVERYLERCVESVLAQTYKNIEVILVDDGSPDSCPQICDHYKLRDNRVIVIHQKNKGLSGARNSGIRIAKGRYITFIDSDDFVVPHYIEQLYNTIIDSGKGISACGHSSVECELSESLNGEFIVFSGKDAVKEVIIDNKIHPSAWGKLYDIALFKKIIFPEGKIFEDYATTPLLLNCADGMAYVDSKLYYYTFNEESITKAAFNDKQLQYFEIADLINSFLSDKYPDLLSYSVSRDVDIAVSFFKKMSKDGFAKAEAYSLLVKRIRIGMKKYLFGAYPIRKKIAAILVVCAPKLAKRFFSN